MQHKYSVFSQVVVSQKKNGFMTVGKTQLSTIKHGQHSLKLLLGFKLLGSS